MSDVIEFGGVQIGDQGRLLVPQVEALGRNAQPMLWSTFADLDDTSRNWTYRIRAAVVMVRNADWKLMQAIGALRAARPTTPRAIRARCASQSGPVRPR